MKTVSILGCGWLGVPLGVALVEEGFSVRGSTTSNSRLELIKAAGIQPYLIDINGPERPENDPFFDSEYLIISLSLRRISSLEGLIERISKSATEKVIFYSSTAVYNNENREVSESDASPDSSYVGLENQLLNNSNFRCVVLRFAGLIGPGRNPINFYSADARIPNPEGFLNLVHQEDCIAATQSVMQSEIWGGVYNFCCDEHPQRADYFLRLAEYFGKVPPNFDWHTANSYKIVSNEKFKKEFDYRFIYPNPYYWE